MMDNRESSDSVASFVERAALDAYATADRLRALGRDDSSARYPGSALAQRLRLIARLLKGGFGARVFYTLQTGFDTHMAKPGTHFQLLNELSGALRRFTPTWPHRGCSIACL